MFCAFRFLTSILVMPDLRIIFAVPNPEHLGIKGIEIQETEKGFITQIN